MTEAESAEATAMLRSGVTRTMVGKYFGVPTRMLPHPPRCGIATLDDDRLTRARARLAKGDSLVQAARHLGVSKKQLDISLWRTLGARP